MFPVIRAEAPALAIVWAACIPAPLAALALEFDIDSASIVSASTITK
jgi:hypothetical protein